MTEPTPRDPGDDDASRQNMIAAITHGIESEDYEFVNEIAVSQNLLRPYEIVEFMDVKRRASEDPVESRRWEDGLGSYLESLEDQMFPEEEVEAINSVIQRLQFEKAVGNEEVAEEPEVKGFERYSDDDDIDWRNDNFSPIDIEQDELARIANTPIGQAVVRDARYAVTHSQVEYLGRARKTIEEFRLGPSDKLRKLLDVYIYQHAEKDARYAVTHSRVEYLGRATDATREYGSDDATLKAMEKSLDKFAFELAKKEIAYATTHGKLEHIKDAIQVIDQYVSSEARMKAMLEELGLA